MSLVVDIMGSTFRKEVEEPTIVAIDRWDSEEDELPEVFDIALTEVEEQLPQYRIHTAVLRSIWFVCEGLYERFQRWRQM